MLRTDASIRAHHASCTEASCRSPLSCFISEINLTQRWPTLSFPRGSEAGLRRLSRLSHLLQKSGAELSVEALSDFGYLVCGELRWWNSVIALQMWPILGTNYRKTLFRQLNPRLLRGRCCTSRSFCGSVFRISPPRSFSLSSCGTSRSRSVFPHSRFPTILKLTCWVCGTHPSTLGRKRARAHQAGEPK
jgi:hypothetical protein